MLAAQTANSYAKKGHIVDHLVLIGSPIDADFLKAFRAQKNIRKVIVIDLRDKGDLIYAGISQLELIKAATTIAQQMLEDKGNGHFYYAHPTPDSPRRWKSLAERIYQDGIR